MYSKMIAQLEQSIAYLQNLGYTPQGATYLLAEYYKQRAMGATADEASCIFFEYIVSDMNAEDNILEEVKMFHKRLCRKGYKPEQVAEVVDAYYNKEE